MKIIYYLAFFCFFIVYSSLYCQTGTLRGVVEDSTSGVKAAIDAGMFVIARIASYNRDMDFSYADFTVKDLREIPPLLEIAPVIVIEPEAPVE